MTIRYGVAATSYECGPRSVVYQPEGCTVCLPIKIGEKQIFDVDFSREVRCNPSRRNCRIDYDEITSVVGFNATPETVFGSGSLAVSVNDVNERTGVVKLLVDATDAQLQSDEKWSVTVSVEFESGRCLKQCFQIRLIPCGDKCEVEEAKNCCGPILAVKSNCSDGTLFIYDEVAQYSGTVCVEISANKDTYYTLDGINPSDPLANQIPLAAGNSIKITNPSEMQGFRMESSCGNCEVICVSRTYRGS